MTLSELKDLLEKTIAQHGDCDLVLRTPKGGLRVCDLKLDRTVAGYYLPSIVESAEEQG